MNEIAKAARATELGLVRINHEAIAAIASTAAMEVRGVYRIGSGAGRKIWDFLCMRTSGRGVKIAINEGEMRLTISIIVYYGAEITKLADDVQENVKHAVEKMTGLALSGVNVVVEGVCTQNEKGRVIQ